MLCFNSFVVYNKILLRLNYIRLSKMVSQTLIYQDKSMGCTIDNNIFDKFSRFTCKLGPVVQFSITSHFLLFSDYVTVDNNYMYNEISKRTFPKSCYFHFFNFQKNGFNYFLSFPSCFRK